MKITFAPRGILQIDDARLVFKNFAGRADKFNREGDRNFAIIIPDEDMANELINLGWNVKIKPPREDGDDPFMYLSVKVKFNDRGLNVYLVTGHNQNRLDEESISCLDNVYMSSVDLDIRPYDWEINGKTGRSAYLQSMRVVQDITDRFAEDWTEGNTIDPNDLPF